MRSPRPSIIDASDGSSAGAYGPCGRNSRFSALGAATPRVRKRWSALRARLPSALSAPSPSFCKRTASPRSTSRSTSAPPAASSRVPGNISTSPSAKARAASESRSSAMVLSFIAWLAWGCSQPVSFPADSNWPSPAIQPFVHQARFAVTDNLSDELSYVDPIQPTLLGNVPVGDVPVELEGPHHIAASPDGKYLYYNLSNYVPGTGSGPHGSHGTGTVPGSVVKLDAMTNEKVGEVLVDRSPGDVILSKDGKTAYISHYDLLRLTSALTAGVNLPDAAYSDVAIVDTDAMTRLAMIPVCATAHGEGLSLDGNTLYVTCANGDELAIVDVTDRNHPSVTTRVTVGP